MNTLKKLIMVAMTALVISCGSAAMVGSLAGQPAVAKEATAETKKSPKKDSSKKETKEELVEEETTAEETVASSTESSNETYTRNNYVASYNSQPTTTTSTVSVNSSQATSNDGSYVGNGGTVHQTAEVVSADTTPETKDQPQIVVDTGWKADNSSISTPAIYDDGTVATEIATDLD